MQVTTIDHALAVQQEGSKWPVFWSWKESGRRQLLPPGASHGEPGTAWTLDLHGDGWSLCEVRWVSSTAEEATKETTKKQHAWWIVCRREDQLAYGLTETEDAYKLIEDIIDHADTLMTMSSMSR